MNIIINVAGLVLTILVLSVIYLRMIKREIPEPIQKYQAVLPVVLGGASLAVSAGILYVTDKAVKASGYKPGDHSALFQSFFPSFFSAAFPEEIAKLVALIISLIILKSRVKNLYEYILVGAAVGMGFTIAEDALYLDGEAVTVLIRLIMIAGHVVLSMIMAEFIGKARFSRTHSEGHAWVYYMLAFLIPLGIHTLYDMGTAFNTPAFSGDSVTGAILGASGVLIMVFAQFFVLIKFRKNAEKYSNMNFALVRDDYAM